ncbi:hypothetical protein C8A03DRAFT_32095 [Achaetomium macrosporum]|uniref:Uncharacterized protein n=1 Tax=Achaetomium macrosporum TaxID=79813 RepID=A0AAN7CD32_9PEZI|nr:hypothetical protein C8A03DRAFT_32095 [Achaetomium macrosporum]
MATRLSDRSDDLDVAKEDDLPDFKEDDLPAVKKEEDVPDVKEDDVPDAKKEDDLDDAKEDGLPDVKKEDDLNDVKESPLNTRGVLLSGLSTSCQREGTIESRYLKYHKEVQRLFEPVEYFRSDRKVKVSWNLLRPERALALAVYILEPDVHREKCCKQCMKRRGPSPSPMCIVPRGDVLGGACTNCFYSGSRARCSIVTEAEEKRKERERREAGGIRPLTPAILKSLSVAELEQLLSVIRKTIERRQNLIWGGRERQQE